MAQAVAGAGWVDWVAMVERGWVAQVVVGSGSKSF